MAITAEDLKKLSPRMKLGLVFFVCLLVGYFYYFFYLQTALEKKGNLESKLSELKQDVAAKQKVAAEKNKYIHDLKKLKETFQLALTKLPDKKEIPGLFESVSVAGRNSGIDFLLFEPLPVIIQNNAEQKGKNQAKLGTGDKGDQAKPEDVKFYTDIPISVKVSGTFQNTLEFFDKVSKLPRIINVENLVLGDRKQTKGKENEIITSCIMKTYMFLDKEKSIEKGSSDAQAKQ